MTNKQMAAIESMIEEDSDTINEAITLLHEQDNYQFHAIQEELTYLNMPNFA